MAADARHSGISVDAAVERSVQKIPMGRMARPEEIADLVLFLASDKASYITATTITMDGAETPLV
jgi:NAD(P)-dependent dehydrogenase (short-subunit alcohol dehydrogenase family)